MPVAATPIPPLEPQHPRRKRWTRAECDRLPAAGIDVEYLELIKGEIYDKRGAKRPHVVSLALVSAWLSPVFAERVNLHAAIDVAPEDNPTNEPQPDLILLKPTFVDDWTTIPGPADVALVVEIADTTLVFDRTVKAALYARAGIPDYWVLDIQDRRLIVHRDPKDGQYASVIAYSEQEPVAPLAAPESFFHAAQALPNRVES